MSIVDQILRTYRKTDIKVTYHSYNGSFWATLLTKQQFEIVVQIIGDRDSDFVFQEYLLKVDWLPIVCADCSEKCLSDLTSRIEKHVNFINAYEWTEAVKNAINHLQTAINDMKENQRYFPKLNPLNPNWTDSVFLFNKYSSMSTSD